MNQMEQQQQQNNQEEEGDKPTSRSNNDSSIYMKRVLLMKNQGDKDVDRRIENPLQIQTSNNDNHFDRDSSLKCPAGYIDQKWEECKILGSNINNRSYSSTIVYDNCLFIYGGYQIDIGILDDFWCIKLNQQDYHWQKVRQNSAEFSPGKRARHSGVGIGQRMIIFGGQYRTSYSENFIYIFDFPTREWTKLNSDSWQQCPEPIDSHCAIQNVLDDNLMIVVCGYHTMTGKFSNAIWKYDIRCNDWSVISPNKEEPSNQYPRGRAQTAITQRKEDIFIFGGTDGVKRLNDLWIFNLVINRWTEVIVQSGCCVPKIRSGHSIAYFDDKLILFGGIHDITWELDDMLFYDLNIKQWVQIDSDSARKKADLGYSPLTKKASPGIGSTKIIDQTDNQQTFPIITEQEKQLQQQQNYQQQNLKQIQQQNQHYQQQQQQQSQQQQKQQQLKEEPKQKQQHQQVQRVKTQMNNYNGDNLYSIQNNEKTNITTQGNPINNLQINKHTKDHSFQNVSNNNIKYKNQSDTQRTNTQINISPRYQRKNPLTSRFGRQKGKKTRIPYSIKEYNTKKQNNIFNNFNNNQINYIDSLNSFDEDLKSPTKTLQEQKHKMLKLKKAEMLKLFELKEEHIQYKEFQRERTPTSQAMNNALSVMGNLEPTLKIRSGKFSELGKATISKFNEPLRDSSPTRIGKRPCARDGHQACIYLDKMIIFGGDRHNMSFNTIYMLDLVKAFSQLD